MLRVDRVADDVSLPELTLRGIVLGALITVVFTASNIYLGLKVGLTFSSAIPAAVISMAVLRLFPGANILENNMVQTQASAAGTLSSIIFILPGLVMLGHWQGFPFWQTLAICAAGGMLGVVFSIPLRHAMVVQSDLPYPEGVAAAEILRVGSAAPAEAAPGRKPQATGLADLMAGGLVAGLFSFAAGGLRVLAEGANFWLSAGASVVRLSMGFSLALVGAGYLVGIVGGLAMLLGLVLTWGVAVPWLTAVTPRPDGATLSAFGTMVWSQQARFIGAGTIGIAAIWTLLSLARPMLYGIRASFGALQAGPTGQGRVPRTQQDLPAKWIGLAMLALLAVLVTVFAWFLAPAPLDGGARWRLVVYAVVFAFIFGFLVAAACGYMAGLVGSSASPISGIGIIAVILVSLLILLAGQADGLLATPEGGKFAIALAIFTTSAVVAVASIANDNLQDLKTGWLVGATPWRQQVALLIGCVVGAAVIPPVLELLYSAYGFAGALPRAGMDPNQALAAPQATLMTAIATGIFTHQLNWKMILIGIGLGVVLIAIDEILRRRGGVARLPVLAVGIGIYLPPTISSALVVGAVLSWLLLRAERRRATARGDDVQLALEHAERRGTLLASGLIVGESLVGVMLAAVIGLSGSDAPLAVVGGGFEATAQWLGLAVFVLVCVGFYRRVLAAAH
ncbi:OPT family oligopeptide transporter [Cupriavidus taiwanensis]|uniref:OPT family oligopeptide transporter n=1 Tax=Cupriavidus taiwanensis TaxID=164546 RepID=UPI000E109E96|nr:oligopeptide transporter, OPT family [Cupriavidus taiwanensis]SOY51334.1 putative oligopeptide transporter [Cupriavidus taiwanensis]SOY51429.1 putative oligopeptide transporter [Cupriavidus taiwanensis]SOY84003.1 putative oligopeptide transporter [Cupriavidus taiwanensis]SOZ58300.1 putative oligopeptide transporter [Cupriavidus taiwanensis]SOZ79946.1 putative oligopeptide transporter [Cupriavidus taiwanensis]